MPQAVVLRVGHVGRIFFVTVFALLSPMGPLAADTVPSALALASQERTRAGLPPLRFDPRLAKAAEVQAQFMAGQGRISHKGPRGSRFDQRMRRAGYRLCHGAENVAMGQRSAEAVTTAWMGSQGHRHNILNPNVVDGAVAVAQDANGRLYWAMVLGAPC